MKILVAICRVFVGILFIFSGMIKLNDPLGFSYKLQEYFSAEVLDLPFLMPYALGISVIVVVLEVVLGVFLLIGYKPKFTVYSLLAMIVFFTFLTFYAAYFDKVKDCGCFGDFLKLTPWQSFTKDIILLVLILVLVAGLKHIKSLFNPLITTVLALFGFIFSLGFGYYVLEHLPVWDFRAYKIGDNIKANMTVPEDAPKEVSEWTWIFNVNGEEKQFVTNGSYPKVNGEYVSYEKKVISEGAEPKIFDFSIESQEEDLTDYFLEKENLVMVVSYNLNSANAEGLKEIKTFTDKAIANGYTVIGVTASGEELKQNITDSFKLNFKFYLCDEKVGKTIVRANPGIIMLKKGTVTQKAHYNDLETLSIPKVTAEETILPSEEIIETEDLETQYFIDNQASTKEAVEALDTETIENMNVVKDTLNSAGDTKINRVEVTLKPKK
jgi:uncharacterized membrane protein YphA (DoxX/SURF4 family)